MTSLWKRLLSLTMVLCMVLCAVSMTAAAYEPDGLIPETAERGSMGEFAWRNPAYPEQGASGTAQNALAGEMINRELYYSDFTTREYVVKELHQAMIERKNEIYLYYKTDKELTEEDMNLLMEDALMLESESVVAGDYLALHVIDFMAVWEPIIEGGTYYNVVGFGVVYSTTAEQEQRLIDKIYELRYEICDGKRNDYQKTKSIYDYIMTNVEYDLDNLENLDYLIQHTGYAALLHGKASAIGYSLLFYRMANEYGLDAEMVAGTIDGNLFIWNVVKLYDKWYQINLGMDALTGSDECFLFGLDDMSAGHKLPDEYLTPEFQAEYPFAKTRFIPEQAGSGKAGDNVTWSYDAATATLTFSGSGKMADQKTEWGASPWFDYIDGGANVVIGEGITYIGASSFWNRNLLSLQLPASLEVIGSGAFSTSAGLKELTLPKNVKKIEQYAFYDSELESIKLPEGLTEIGQLAFASCSKLAAVKLPDSLTTIGDNAFSDSGLTEIFIPRNVTSIGGGAFSANRENYDGFDYETLVAVKKYEVHPENTVYSAKDGLLLSKDGTKLLAVPNDRKGTFMVPDGVTEIGDGAFQYCEQLQGVIFPEGLTKIGEKAFLWNKQLNYVKIPDSVTEIGAYAFEYCKDLLSVQLPTGLTEISEGLFKGSNLRTVQVPEGVTVLGKDAFKESYVYSVALPISLKTVEAGAFGGLYGKFDEQFSHVYYAGTQEQWNAVSVAENNDALKNAELHLGERALSGGGWKYDISEGRLEITSAGINTYPWLGWRDEIKSVYWNESPNYMNEITIKIGAGMFKNCSNLKVFAFRDDVKYNGIMGRIAGEAFYGCTSLETFTVPGSVYWIYDRAFGDCTSLKTVYLSRDLRGVAQEAFAGCTALTDVYVDKTEAEWAENTVPGGGEKVNPFMGMPNVTVHFAEAVTGGDLGNNLEWSYDKDSRTLTISGQGPMRDFAEGEERPWDEWVNEGGTFNLVIEEGVTSIGARAFKKTDGQNKRGYKIQFASTVKEIREEAFYGCDYKDLAFNTGLEIIGARAFANGWLEWDQNNDNVLILPDTLVTVGNSAFCNTNCDILYLPASLKTIGEFAFSTNTGTKIYYGGSEAQWKQMQIGDQNYALLPEYGDYKQPVYNSGCPHAVYLLRAVEATCTETGLTAGKYCGGCGEVFEAQQVVPKTPHNFVNCECTKCGMTIDPSWPLDGVCGEHLTWSYDLNSGKLTVSGEGAMQNYTSDKDVPWSVWGEYITSVSIANTVTAIGDNAFAGLDQLKDVYFDSTKWSWQNIAVGKGNEALTNAKLHTTEAFTDVLQSDWFYGPVNWAVSANVTGGLGNGLFGPNNYCTRAQVVTFLYAAAGKPEVTTTENPFTDVPDNAWYLKPVLWAVENGITGGTSPTTFGPDNYCTRAQVVTFLYAAAGKPEITANSTFDDVKDSDWFAKPVIWAKENDVTGGINATQFGPNQTCTRAQVVTFLYKVYG